MQTIGCIFLTILLLLYICSCYCSGIAHRYAMLQYTRYLASVYVYVCVCVFVRGVLTA